MATEVPFPHWGVNAYLTVNGESDDERNKNMVAFWDKVYDLADKDPNIPYISWEWTDDHDYCDTCTNIESLNHEAKKQEAADEVEQALKTLNEKFQTAAYDSSDYSNWQVQWAALMNLRAYFNSKTGRVV